MTVQTISRPVAPAPRRTTVRNLTDLRVIRSEWIKLFSLRSTWYTLVAILVGTAAIGAGVAFVIEWQWDSMNASDREAFNAIDLSMSGIVLAQLIVAVLGVQIVTNEYATGMIRSSLAAVPRRLMLLRGKVVVSAAVSLAVSVVACFGTFFLSQALLQAQGVTIGDEGALRAILGSAFFLMAIAVISTGIGFVTRSTAGGIGAVVALLLVLPVFGGLIPVDIIRDLMDYLPGTAGTSLYSVGIESPAMSPLVGFLTLCGWMALAVIAGGVAIRRRDA